MAFLDETGLEYLWNQILERLNKLVPSETGKGLSANDLTDALKTQYDNAYAHSQETHAPSDAEANVQADWSITDSTSDAYIKNKPDVATQSDLSAIESVLANV